MSLAWRLCAATIILAPVVALAAFASLAIAIAFVGGFMWLAAVAFVTES